MSPRTVIAVALLGAPATASAFCGHYVGNAGASLYNHLSQVVMVRDGTTTTLTLANDLSTDATDFALVIPVPEVLSQDDVAVVDPALFAVVDGYSAPRRVTYTCDDFYFEDGVDYDTSQSGEGGGNSSGSVTVEAEFAVGEYEIVILSATDSENLIAWLDANEYAITVDAADLLQEYIDGGSYFFAAKVSLDAVPEGQTTLSPLQFGYTSDVWSLPIRIGTLSSEGTQDLLIYAITPQADGAAGIANYPEAALEYDCMWDAAGWEDDFGAFYDAQLDAAVNGGSRPGWVREYSWSPSGCDPCSSDPPTAEQLAELGFDAAANDAWFTRIHMRYTPDGADQDLVLYTSGLQESDQVKYIDYDPHLEDRFPICGVGFVEDPGTCNFPGDGDIDGDGIPDDLDDDIDGDGLHNSIDDDDDGDGILDVDEAYVGGGIACGGCATGAPASLAGFLLAAAAAQGRRRTSRR